MLLKPAVQLIEHVKFYNCQSQWVRIQMKCYFNGNGCEELSDMYCWAFYVLFSPFVFMTGTAGCSLCLSCVYASKHCYIQVTDAVHM